MKVCLGVGGLIKVRTDMQVKFGPKSQGFFPLSISISLAPPESVLSDGNGRRAKDARSLLVDNSILRPPLSLASCFIIRAAPPTATAPLGK